jgi:hypothetical protein
MSDLWLPPSARPVQIQQKQRVCVLTHINTGRILCFCLDDAFASTFEHSGYLKHEIHHAHEYDMWAKRLREQAKQDNEAEDFAYLEREDGVRKRLRQQLTDVIQSSSKSNADKKAAESALHCLDYMERKKKRYRAESFMVQEAYESSKNAGEDLVNEIMVPKKK